MENVALEDNIQELMALLTDRERQVIGMLYGMDGDLPMKTMDIAIELGITQQRVSSIEVSSYKKMLSSVVLLDKDVLALHARLCLLAELMKRRSKSG